MTDIPYDKMVREMKSEELSHHLWEVGKELVVAENQWFWVQEQKKIMLANLALQFESRGHGVTKSQSLARTDTSFREHLDVMREALENRDRAKVRYKEIDFDIRRRLNKSFMKNQEARSQMGNT